MGILNNLATDGLRALGVQTEAGVQNPDYLGPNFPEGFLITPIIDGREDKSRQVRLTGRFMPHIPLEYGGKQRLVREDYPGNSEPTIQVLGSSESDTTIRGILKTNKFRGGNPEEVKQYAIEYQEALDQIRLAGDLLKLSLGDEWYRYAFLEESKFRMNTLQTIEYELRFLIVGFNPPLLDKTTRQEGDVIAPNRQLIDAAASALDEARNYPASMPLTAADILNRGISRVAEAIALVTNFTNGVVQDAQQIVGSANRAIGLIKNARATISRTAREIGQISTSVSNLGSSFANEADKTIATINNIGHLQTTKRGYGSLALLLASLQRQFESYVKTVPLARHLVRQGDTLQKISMKFYNTSENWEKIYTHNKLTSTTLVVGSILEIPRV